MSRYSDLSELNAENITQSDAAADYFDPPLVGLIICAPGAVTYKNGRGETVVVTVGASAVDPFYLWGQIRQVLDTGTAVANANLIGLRKGGQTVHVHE